MAATVQSASGRINFGRRTMRPQNPMQVFCRSVRINRRERKQIRPRQHMTACGLRSNAQSNTLFRWKRERSEHIHLVSLRVIIGSVGNVTPFICMFLRFACVGVPESFDTCTDCNGMLFFHAHFTVTGRSEQSFAFIRFCAFYALPFLVARKVFVLNDVNSAEHKFSTCFAPVMDLKSLCLFRSL